MRENRYEFDNPILDIMLEELLGAAAPPDMSRHFPSAKPLTLSTNVMFPNLFLDILKASIVPIFPAPIRLIFLS